jgi:hypothetical protein
MKRLLCILCGAMLIFGIAANASAYFQPTSLILFGYTPGGNEVGYDLGDTATLDFTAQNQVLAGPGSIDWLADTGAASLDQINVGMYSGNSATFEWWFVTTQANMEPSTSFANAQPFWNAQAAIQGTYGSRGTQKVTGVYSAPGSYGQAMNKTDTARGSYSAFNEDFTVGELNLADTAGLSDLFLYHFFFDAGNIVLDPGADTLHIASFDIRNDGSVVMNAVPIPASVLLLGSGLLGLVGLRRRQKAA